MQRRFLNASRKVEAVAQVSTRALKVVSLKPSSRPFSVSLRGFPDRQKGTSPQRIFSSSQAPFSSLAVTCWVVGRTSSFGSRFKGAVATDPNRESWS